MIVPLSLARSLFNYDKEVTAVELKVKDSGDIAPVKKEIQRILGDQYIVQDRFEQQEASFKMMQVEKWMTFLILWKVLWLKSSHNYSPRSEGFQYQSQ